jgi:hypothetical protein
MLVMRVASELTWMMENVGRAVSRRRREPCLGVEQSRLAKANVNNAFDQGLVVSIEGRPHSSGIRW